MEQKKNVSFREMTKNYRGENGRDAVQVEDKDDYDAKEVCSRISKLLSRPEFELFKFPQATDSDSDEYDTDLDECPDLKDAKTTRDYSPKNCRDIYLKACRDLDIVPASIFSKQCDTSSIDLKHYGVGVKGARAVAMALKYNQTVKHLNLHDNDIGEVGVSAICNMVAVNVWITNLDLSGNSVGKTGLTALANMIKNAFMLKNLTLSRCKIQGSGAQTLVSALSVNRGLETLDLSYNEIGDNGAGCFEGVFTNNTFLKSLDISFNGISFLGVEAFTNGLSDNGSLVELNLAWNGMEDIGASCISTVLDHNTSLKVLDVRHNHISATGIESIADSLQDNSTLEVLKIGRNPFLANGACAILKSLQGNLESSLRELVLDGIAFDKDCERELSTLASAQPNFVCKWDGSIQGGAVITGEQVLPTELYLTAMYSQGFRLLDFYRYLKRDEGGLLLKEDFIVGSKKRTFPFSEKELGSLFDFLDTKQRGSISYDEFLFIKNDIKQAKQKRNSTIGSTDGPQFQRLVRS